jgi:tRNA(Arg) A34 adenosine deaminase TadA
MSSGIRIVLPDWVATLLEHWEQPLDGDEACMALAIELSAENVRQGTGGPFGAVVVDLVNGELLGAGINLVTTCNLSAAHAEIVAISMAQQSLSDWNLGRARALTLATSCEPCAMCYGAIPWSGVQALLCGARLEDAERAGFDEGDKPDQWVEALEDRQIAVRCDILRREAAAVLGRYRSGGGEIYNPFD